MALKEAQVLPLLFLSLTFPPPLYITQATRGPSQVQDLTGPPVGTWGWPIYGAWLLSLYLSGIRTPVQVDTRLGLLLAHLPEGELYITLAEPEPPLAPKVLGRVVGFRLASSFMGQVAWDFGVFIL